MELSVKVAILESQVKALQVKSMDRDLEENTLVNSFGSSLDNKHGFEEPPTTQVKVKPGFSGGSFLHF